MDLCPPSSFCNRSPPLHKAMTVLKAFKKRYFVLDEGTSVLKYYTSSTADQLKGEIDMEAVRRAMLL